MAAVALFWDTNMAAMTSCKNTQLINHDCREAILTVKLRVDPGWFIHQAGRSDLFLSSPA